MTKSLPAQTDSFKTQDASAVNVSRVVAFVGMLLGGSFGDGESKQLASDILYDLMDSCSSKLACVRIRSLHIIEAILSQAFVSKATLPTDLCSSLITTLAERLDDKEAKARRASVSSISSLLHLASSDVSKSLVGSLIECLAVERTMGVRSAIISTLPLNGSIGIILERTLDVSSEVRAAAYGKLKEASPSDLTPGVVSSLILQGSKDEDTSVKAQVKGLIVHWAASSSFTSELQGDPVEGFISFLLSTDDLDSSIKAVNLALEILVESNALDCAAKIRQMTSSESSSGVRPTTFRKASELAALTNQPLSISIPTARSVLWRFLCSSVRSSASSLSQQAAATTGASSASLAGQASALNDLLESFMPESASLAFSVILGLARGDRSSPESWMIVQQLMEIVTNCFDWTDFPSRQAASEAVDSLALVSSSSKPASWPTSLIKLLVSIHGGGSDIRSPSPLALSAMLQLVTRLADVSGIKPDSLVNMSKDGLNDLSQVLNMASHSFSIASVMHPSYEDKDHLERLLAISLASLDQKDEGIRLLAVDSMASAALVPCLKDSHLQSIVSSLVAAFEAKEKKVKVSILTQISCKAASGLTSLVLCYGQEIDHLLGGDQGDKSIIKIFLDAAHSSLSLNAASDSFFLEQLTECLAKMMLHQELQSQMSSRVELIPMVDKRHFSLHLNEASSQQVIATLLLLSVHPSVADEVPKIDNILSATWREFLSRSTTNNTVRLAQAAFSAVRLASTIESGSGKSASNLAPALIKKVAQLLDLSQRILASQSQASAAADGRGTLALQILLSLSQTSSESHPGMKRSDVQKELAKLLCLLTPHKSEQRTIKACLILIERISQQNQIDSSAAALIQSKIKSEFEEAEEPGDSEVGIEEMLQSLSLSMSDEAPTAIQAVKKKKGAVTKKAPAKKKAESEDDDRESDEQDDVEEEDQQRPAVVKVEGKSRARPRSRAAAPIASLA